MKRTIYNIIDVLTILTALASLLVLGFADSRKELAIVGTIMCVLAAINTVNLLRDGEEEDGE